MKPMSVCHVSTSTAGQVKPKKFTHTESVEGAMCVVKKFEI